VAGRKKYVDDGTAERLFAYRSPGELGGVGTPIEGMALGRLGPDGLVRTEGRAVPFGQLSPAPPVPRPGKIVCIGLNYRDHVAEGSRETPDRPLIFSKFSNAVVADGEPVIRPVGSHALDLEGELGVVIGRLARHVSAAEAYSHVLGYVVLNDISARDWQGSPPALHPGEHGDGQWLRAKGSDSFLPMGPVLAFKTAIPDPHCLRIRSWHIPGHGPNAGTAVLMQDGNTADMIFRIPQLIEFVSASISLDPGDVISTGTPAGVGVFRTPPVFLEPGDRVRVEIDGIGSVENPIVAGD
jgi:2-keto-4-pentenoate hydratase/2-oxohepta-3-ene-1,7-dioic acid hydratase in catechol pathway